jgi:hypothetical protein
MPPKALSTILARLECKTLKIPCLIGGYQQKWGKHYKTLHDNVYPIDN